MNTEARISNEGEVGEKHYYHLRVMRHAPRMASGELRPEGIEKARGFGVTLEDSQVVKGYASTEKTGRTVMTADLVSEGSGVESPLKKLRIDELKEHDEFDKANQIKPRYETRRVQGIDYDAVDKDLLKIVVKAIDRATLEELHRVYGWSVEGLDLKNPPEDMSEKDKILIAEVRQKNQEVGFEMLVQEPVAVHQMAIGLAHQMIDKLELMGRYDKAEEKIGDDEADQKGDVNIDLTSHGMFMESILMEAGVSQDTDGDHPHKINDFKEIGGYFQTNESFYLDLEDPKNIPDLIPVVFDSPERPGKGKIFVEKNRLALLDIEYREKLIEVIENKLINLDDDHQEEAEDLKSRLDNYKKRLAERKEKFGALSGNA